MITPIRQPYTAEEVSQPRYEVYYKGLYDTSGTRMSGSAINKPVLKTIGEARELINQLAHNSPTGTKLYVRHMQKGAPRYQAPTDIEAYEVRNSFPELLFSRYKRVGVWGRDWPRHTKQVGRGMVI